MSATWQAVIHTRDGRTACRIQAMADGIRALGGEPLFEDPVSPARVRFVVAWGGSFVDAAWRGKWRGLGVPVLIMELGYLKRCAGSGDPEGYSQLGHDRIGWLPPREDFSSDRFDALGLTVGDPLQGRGKVLLVLGQVPHDAQHNLGPEALAGWLTEQAAAFASAGWQIHFRPHPRHTLQKIHIPHERLEIRDSTLEQCFARVGAVLTYNSTAGVEALLAGLPVHCHESAHFACVRGAVSRAQLQRYLNRLAYAQWTCAELATGEPIRLVDNFAWIFSGKKPEAAA